MATIALRGKGSKGLRRDLFSHASPCLECALHQGVTKLAVTHAYKHMGSMTVANFGPTLEVGNRVKKTVTAYYSIKKRALANPRIPTQNR
eukprot:14826232-Alexandrium_andersonii.AAC.1